MGVAKGRQLGSLQRIREKMQEKTASELADERENVRKAESKITKLEENVESAETRVRVALARAVRAEIRCDRIPDLEQQLQSTQHLLHAKVEEIKALTTQYRATLSTQQDLQYNAQQKEKQLQEKVRENAALQAHNQALANQVVALQSTVAQLEQRMQATVDTLADTQKQIFNLEQQLHSKEAQMQLLTQPHHKLSHGQPTMKPATASLPTQTGTAPISVLQPTQLGLQTGAIGPHYPTELPVQHAEMQQKVTGDIESLLPANEEIQELQHQLKIRAIENQEQREQLTTLQTEDQKIRGQIKLMEIEEQKLQEQLTKETFLENTFGYEVDLLREDLMDREEELYSLRTQQVQQCTTSSDVMAHDTRPPTTSPTSGKTLMDIKF